MIVRNVKSQIVSERFREGEYKEGTPCIRLPRPGGTCGEVYLGLSKLVYVGKEEKIQFRERESQLAPLGIGVVANMNPEEMMDAFFANNVQEEPTEESRESPNRDVLDPTTIETDKGGMSEPDKSATDIQKDVSGGLVNDMDKDQEDSNTK
ncbi:hypothetical protein M9H77_18611 [Catharanthus roseus]|uniref:Uncharacterized protein n=1 Tax=Catharanthus roseus TaxID=4058 RepID=A0ACC0B878_CATRO|nr:hypothetical protein M9H77_18611 [Catharanthus roseus]